MGNPILKIHTNGLLPLLLASLALPVSAQVSSENYVQTTQRISDTRVLATTQYYDGLDRPFEKVEQRVSPSGDNLIHLQQYDGLGRNMQDGNLRKQGQWLFSQYYGKKGRVVQSHSSNLLGGWEHSYSSYTYAGSLQQTKHVHTTNGKQDVVEEYDYAYDHVGRLVKTTYCVNGSDKRELSVVDYDNYGRILLENIMGKDEVLYDYNAQNMLTDSGYNEGDRQNDGQGNYDESLSYDKMGNVQSLLRSGLLDDGSYGLIDNLSYNYHGNQLLKVDDAAVGPYYQGAFHFVDGADEAVEYEYDANGNLVRDLNKGIISISYDLNNQPRKIEYNDGRNVSYLSDAEGSKLSVSYNLTAMSSAQPQMPVMQSSDVASANVSNGQKTIDYCGNIIYDGDETMILNDVGYALCNKDNNLSFHYYLKDHLGNNRVVVSENGEIEQVNDYYPTGALMASSKGGDTQRFKFNGKELDRTNGLNWYDYGARNYDAAIVRWDGMDKLCEKYSPFTPYGYCKNNFVNAYDKDGNDVFVLLAPNGAGGCGHMAILIQNNDKTWSLWSKNGTPEHSHAYGKEGKRGSPYHNNRGGSIKGQPTSYKNILEFFKSSDNPIVDGVPEYTEGFLIKTTTKQDEKVKNGISKELNKDYNVLSSNCAQAVQEGLKNAGLNYGKGILPKKQVYPSITRVSIIS